MPVVIYATKGSGNCFKAQLAMRQLGIAHETRPVDVLAGETRGPAFRALNPRGTVPFLVLEDGRTLAESNAMLWLLANGTPLIPADAYRRAKAVEWMIVEQTKLEPFISPARFFTAIAPERGVGMDDQIVQWRKQGAAGLAMLDDHLARSVFMLGDDYSIADIAVFGYVHVADEAGLPLADYPNVRRWTGDVAATRGFVSMADVWRDVDAGVAVA